jgi:hypothetical protein
MNVGCHIPIFFMIGAELRAAEAFDFEPSNEVEKFPGTRSREKDNN